MKKLLALTLALAAWVMLGTASHAQIPPSPSQLSLPCCKCLGEATTINLNTGQASPNDPIWRVNNGPAFTTPPFRGWMNLPPARWIQPVANPTPSGQVQPSSIHNYTVQFNVPKCTIPGTAQLTGRFAADNIVRAFLDNNGIPGANCTTGLCYTPPDAPKPLNVANIAPGLHILRFEVRNKPGPPSASGLIVNAQLKRQCQHQ